jgi:hypothetical protein
MRTEESEADSYKLIAVYYSLKTGLTNPSALSKSRPITFSSTMHAGNLLIVRVHSNPAIPVFPKHCRMT